MSAFARRPRPRRDGSAAVEFAVVATVFFTVVFAVFEFAWLNVVRHAGDVAAYEAVRQAVVPGATAADAIAEVDRVLGAIGVRGAVVTIAPPAIAETTTSVTVSVAIPVDANSLVTPAFAGGQTLTSSATLLTERTFAL